MRKILWMLIPFILLPGCRDDESAPPAIVTFENSSSQVEEDGNYKVIDVVLSHAMDTDVEVAFETGGNAALNGHYALITPSPIIIEAGSTRGEIVFEAIDNSVLEVRNATFAVELTSANGGQLGEAAALSHQVEIIDNNEVPQNDLQLDLLWSLEGDQDIDQVSMMLLLTSDLEIEENAVESFNTVAESEGESGFETVLLQENEPDKEYYILVVYMDGNHDVDFQVNVSNSAFGTGLFLEDRFTANQVGYGQFYGPIYKEGTDYYGGRKSGARLSPSKTAVSPLLLNK